MARYLYVLLDSDDTLLDFQQAERKALLATLVQYGVEPSEENLNRYHEINDELWHSYERQEIDKPQLLRLRAQRFFASVGRAAPERFNQDYLESLGCQGDRLDGALELCQRISQTARLYVVTNGTGKAARNRLKLAGISPYLSGIFVSEELGCQKPMRAFFDHTLAALGNPDRGQVILLGDRLSSDIEGGRRAGIATCWYCPDRTAPDVPGLYDYRIGRLCEFDSIVEGRA